nr:molybdopterin molybdotransferase MoeA [Actinomycetota bacterium]
GVVAAPCARRPRVGVLVTGDELVEPQDRLRPGAVRNTNAYAVAAQAVEAGAEVVLSDTVADDREATVAAIERALGLDVVVICGGMSVGAHDHVRPALAELGVERGFFGVALKPGKPTWFGVHRYRGGERRVALRDQRRGALGNEGRGTLAFGLPGNPVSAMVTFHLFVRPALAALAGACPGGATVPATMVDDYLKAPGRTHAVRCRAELRGGEWLVRPLSGQGSHVLTSMVQADALALLGTQRGNVRAGEPVEVDFLGPPPTGRAGPWPYSRDAGECP